MRSSFSPKPKSQMGLSANNSRTHFDNLGGLTAKSSFANLNKSQIMYARRYDPDEDPGVLLSRVDSRLSASRERRKVLQAKLKDWVTKTKYPKKEIDPGLSNRSSHSRLIDILRKQTEKSQKKEQMIRFAAEDIKAKRETRVRGVKHNLHVIQLSRNQEMQKLALKIQLPSTQERPRTNAKVKMALLDLKCTESA